MQDTYTRVEVFSWSFCFVQAFKWVFVPQFQGLAKYSTCLFVALSHNSCSQRGRGWLHSSILYHLSHPCLKTAGFGCRYGSVGIGNVNGSKASWCNHRCISREKPVTFQVPDSMPQPFTYLSVCLSHCHNSSNFSCVIYFGTLEVHRCWRHQHLCSKVWKRSVINGGILNVDPDHWFICTCAITQEGMDLN